MIMKKGKVCFTEAAADRVEYPVESDMRKDFIPDGVAF